MPAAPAIPGLLCCISALILLVFVTVSAPVWNSISFLDVDINGKSTHFGFLGYTGSSKQLGYYIDSTALGFNYDGLNTLPVRGFTATMILHPMAAVFALFAAIFGFCGAGYSRIGTILMSLSAALATLITLIIWVIDMAFWGVVRNRIRQYGPTGTSAQYGNANWLTLGAVFALLLGFCTAAFGACGQSLRRREKV